MLGAIGRLLLALMQFFPASQGVNWVASLAPPPRRGFSFEQLLGGSPVSATREAMSQKRKRPQEMQALGQFGQSMEVDLAGEGRACDTVDVTTLYAEVTQFAVTAAQLGDRLTILAPIVTERAIFALIPFQWAFEAWLPVRGASYRFEEHPHCSGDHSSGNVARGYFSK